MSGEQPDERLRVRTLVERKKRKEKKTGPSARQLNRHDDHSSCNAGWSRFCGCPVLHFSFSPIFRLHLFSIINLLH